MQIASWNVNSIKARLDHVVSWLEKNPVDILLLQELKGLEFPDEAFAKIGYQTNTVTQKAYNGVALISKIPVNLVHTALPGNKEDEQARYIEAETGNIHVIGIYAPNGNPVDTEKFTYKLSWLDRLYDRLFDLRKQGVPFCIGGDFNIIPETIDCYDPTAWREDALFRLESRQRLRSLLNLGLTDALRVFHKNSQQYTYWDYQRNAFIANKGIRIDHFLCSPDITDRLINCQIDVEPRAKERPSDHTPIMIEISTP